MKEARTGLARPDAPPRRAPPALRIGALALVGLGIAGALLLRHQRLGTPASQATTGVTGARMIELGSTSCRSCKAMHQELARLRAECGTSIGVEEIDVWVDEDAAGRYDVTFIPTQIFLDGDGREFGRHVGFLARGDILARFAQRGVECRP